MSKAKAAVRFPAAALGQALAYAAEVHADQNRKGGDTPYFAHPMLAATLAMEYGADLEQVQAALLHDVLEDGRGSGPENRERLRRSFGERVYAMVDLCTDSDTDSACGPKAEWLPRKQAYLERLAAADADARLVAAADKLANVLTTLFDLRRHGSTTWKRFRQGREAMLWYYRRCVAALRQGESPQGLRQLLTELEARIAELENGDPPHGAASRDAASGRGPGC
ncbi:MAG: HD domain-containing protein [Acidobacteriota bacterium]|nr:HD domain-containing protein [Acidobacteriota bacterium]